jgi:Dienelactone hydrolase and related enzymes
METVDERWVRLAPHVQVFGPADSVPRPAVILFHGCGGLRPHLPLYAQAAAAAGWRAFIVDSYAPRGWNRTLALSMVCTGLLLQGWQRAGDVVAAVHGISARADVDGHRIALAGWSHGGWSMMEAFSADRLVPGALYLKDANTVDLSGIKAAWLAYAYVGFAAFNRMRPWRIHPRTLNVIAREDHLTTVRNARTVSDAIQSWGAEVETWIADGTHSFDEPISAPPMRHDPALTRQAIDRFVGLLQATA